MKRMGAYSHKLGLTTWVGGCVGGAPRFIWSLVLFYGRREGFCKHGPDPLSQGKESVIFKKEARRILTDELPKWPGETHLCIEGVGKGGGW